MVTRIIFSSKILFIQISLIPYPLFVKVLQAIDFIDCQIFQMSVKAHKVVHTELMKYIAMRMTHAILIYQEPLKAFPQINII